jgi:Holliday junction DNA helicase RuvA
MYEHLRGILVSSLPGSAVIEAGGIGFRLLVPLSTSRVLPAPGQEARLFLHHTLNAEQGEERLYGFATERERELFRALVTVKGVGPATAHQMMCVAESDELIEAIGSGAVDRLRKFRGIGPKRAEMLVLELRERLAPLRTGTQAPRAGTAPSRKPEEQDALLALLALGYPAQKAEQAVQEAVKQGASGVEALVRRALQLI